MSAPAPVNIPSLPASHAASIAVPSSPSASGGSGTTQGAHRFAEQLSRENASSGRVLETGPETEAVVLTPSRLRVDSRVVFCHSTAHWLTNSIFCVFILLKLLGTAPWSWWIIFIPTWVNHAVHIPLQIVVLAYADHLIYKQIGPPPLASATTGLHLQYAILRKTRLKSHIIDSINGLIETTAMLIVKIVFCWMLQTGRLHSVSFRLLCTPFWVSWAVTLFLSCMKDKSERMFGSTRDLLYIFFLFLSFKVDNQSSYSWRVVFLIPWMWFSALFLLALLVMVLLFFARVWSRLLELLLPVGFLCLLLSTVPQFVSYMELVKGLDANPYDVNYEAVLIPNALSWFCMWLSSIILTVGLRQKERVREFLLRTGRVWTRHEFVARRMNQEREAAQQKIDNLSEEEIAKLVEEMMTGKAKPGQLVRVGSTLYKRLTSFDETMTTDVRKEDAELSQNSQELQDVRSTEITSEPASNSLRVQVGPGPNNASSSSVAAAGHTSVEVVVPGAALPDSTSEGCKQQPEETTGAIPGFEVLRSASPTSFAVQEARGPGTAGGVRADASIETTVGPSDDELCVICYDNAATCVFLECGHGGFCRKCANLLFVRPPNECPTCRTRIEQVLELQQISKVGEVTSVKL